MRRSICCLLLAAICAGSNNVGAFLTPSTSTTIISPSTIRHTKSGGCLFMSEEKKDTGPKNGSTSQNEFSRTIRVNKWFGAGGTSSGPNNRRNKSMNLSVSATSPEREALATRFRLSNISALSAEVVVQPAVGDADDSGSIEALGTITAQVTQTCVRTNEAFDIDLEFTFHTVLRAMEAVASSGTSAESQLSEGELAALEAAAQLDGGGRQQRKKKKGGGKQKRDKGVRGGQSSRDLDAMGMKELQNILQEYEVQDEIIEDESCFCTDGIVDVGEIVAQMFRSKLDPYPKKPGTDPVSYSFTF
ncbi:hypothetical protein QTG54_000464 [Skeletonema marinoi]|uniref:Plastid lipid-associated protein/fibrillin conserved domain-containing protein n=2 Tax=Skeletonema marinoi TaxID=267567 RepID=A0AAD8YNE7_9STRA|nr:hypothetical protein QTG54_000464 [Skeletonema marinoi]|mmetsp:Transcript_15663/g.26694  ORF Transcript_15663/g.26694 Transcript_15663/m.26694 type:complete len:303 (+) Transcript_15663:105-1013(+)